MITLSVTLKIKLRPTKDILTDREFKAARDVKGRPEGLGAQALGEAEDRAKQTLAGLPDEGLELESAESRAKANIQC